MKKKLTIACMVLLLLSLTACGRTKEYTFGTGGIGGNYYSYANALESFLETDGIAVDVKTTAGSAANLRLMQKGFLDLAIVQSDVLLDAYNGVGEFSSSPCSGVRAIAGLYTEECQIVVSADSDIYSVKDMYEKRVSVGELESGVMQNAKQILAAYGLSLDAIEASYLSFSDSAAALKDGKIDAFFCTAGAPTTAVLELSKEYDIRLISLDIDICERLAKEYPCYSKCEIAAGTYQGMDNDVTTLGVKAVLIASNKVSDEFVNYLTDTLFNHSTDLRYAVSANELDPSFAATNIPIPFHSGASSWYSKHNYEVETVAAGTVSYGITAYQD